MLRTILELRIVKATQMTIRMKATTTDMVEGIVTDKLSFLRFFGFCRVAFL
jgi:hypothetical protein